jgi:cation diffusion facilitator family transporter
MTKSKKSIYSALAANILIAITKFIAGSISNSSAMIAEGVHSVVDTINELLLLYGIRLSKKPADALRPFGYGKELYFWSFIVALLIFGLEVASLSTRDTSISAIPNRWATLPGVT